MITKMTISPIAGSKDELSQDLARKAQLRGFGVDQIVRSTVVALEGLLPLETTKKIAQTILTDPVTEEFTIGEPKRKKDWLYCYIFVLPGVTNPVEETLHKAIADSGLRVTNQLRVGIEMAIKGLNKNQVLELAEQLFYNPAIERCDFDLTPSFLFSTLEQENFKTTEIPLLHLNGSGLLALSQQNQLSLNLDEMKAIQTHYANQGREPTDIELETLAQTWSEHCCHKTLTSQVETQEGQINNILKSTIMKSTEVLNKDWCLSVFKDNAGVIAFDEKDAVTFKVETHNHPSAIEPYGGAGTGLGGCIRDTLGTGQGAFPIANTDVFCFAPIDTEKKDLPEGVLAPTRLMESVVAGVRDYGNRMGIPTVNGSLCFDPNYVGNPLVFCGSVGLIPQRHVDKHIDKSDCIVALGGRTGRDGIHGATFSSIELDEDSQTHSKGAVQIGNPIVEKMLMDVLIQARDQDLIKSVTDCGAGGFSSAIGEMAEELGATVDLKKAPLKYTGLKYWEVWISESQERMVLAVSPENLEAVLQICAAENVEATVLGTFGTENRNLILNWGETEVGRLSMEFLHDGRPKLTRKAITNKNQPKRGQLPHENPDEILLKILQSPNVASKEWVIRQYDHEVQAGSIIKPLVGPANDGPSDAAVIAPKLNSHRGLAISNGINPHYGYHDSYAMTAACVDEALRNIICVGGNLERCALLDNFSWGNTSEPEGLGSILEASQACHDAALSYGTPFISGKDSLNNEYQSKEGKIIIPNTILISAMAVMPDVRKSITMDLKSEGNLIFLVGQTYWELGGSHLNLVSSLENDSTVPQTNFETNRKTFESLARAIEKGLVRSAHDLSEGGFAVAAAEMAFAGDVGAEFELNALPTSEELPDAVKLFSESTGRFLIEVSPENVEALNLELDSIVYSQVGKTIPEKTFSVKSGEKTLIHQKLETLKKRWQDPLNLDLQTKAQKGQ